MKVLVIGAGQIGKAIHALLVPYHEVFIRDFAEEQTYPAIDVLHICYPDSEKFVEQTIAYQKQYVPSLTIIHSSVAIGKTADCGGRTVHCPVRGRHPNLAREIPAFTLFVGGSDRKAIVDACDYLRKCELVTRPIYLEGATELCKLLSNVHMGLEIAWRQEVERMLTKFDIHPDIYEAWEESYNFGYRITGDEHLTRPNLQPAPIGGHCILECVDILAKQFDSKLFEFIVDSNERAKHGLAQGQTQESTTGDHSLSNSSR